MQPVSIEVQDHTSPSEIRWPRRRRVTGAWKIFVLYGQLLYVGMFQSSFIVYVRIINFVNTEYTCYKSLL